MHPEGYSIEFSDFLESGGTVDAGLVNDHVPISLKQRMDKIITELLDDLLVVLVERFTVQHATDVIAADASSLEVSRHAILAIDPGRLARPGNALHC